MRELKDFDGYAISVKDQKAFAKEVLNLSKKDFEALVRMIETGQTATIDIIGHRPSVFLPLDIEDEKLAETIVGLASFLPTRYFYAVKEALLGITGKNAEEDHPVNRTLN